LKVINSYIYVGGICTKSQSEIVGFLLAAICSLEPQVVLGISEYFQDVEHIATLPIVENAAG